MSIAGPRPNMEGRLLRVSGHNRMEPGGQLLHRWMSRKSSGFSSMSAEEYC